LTFKFVVKLIHETLDENYLINNTSNAFLVNIEIGDQNKVPV